MTRRTIVRTGVRAAVGVVTLAIGAGVIAGAAALPLPSLTENPAGKVVTPVALDQQRVCGGSLLRLAGDSGASATSVTAVGTATTVTGAGDQDTPERTNLAGSDGTSSDPLLVTAAASGTRIPLVAGAQSQNATESDLRGYAAAPCQEPTSSTWLVGGSTETGRTTLINLVNPTDVNSTVDLSVFAESGAVQGPGLQGIVVGPKSQKVVPLSGFATGLTSPIVHVTSRGGQIGSSLQVGVVRTLEAGGADIVSAAAPPSREVVIPGVVVRDGKAVQSASTQQGYRDLDSVVRAFVPGTTNAQLSIQLNTTDGNGATFTATAQSGQVTDLPLDDLADGDYSATIESSVPIVAGVRTSTISADGGTDLSWVGSAPALTTTTMFTVAPGPKALLTVTNPTNKAVKAVLTRSAANGLKAATTPITVAGNSTSSLPVAVGAVETLTNADGLHAGLSYAESGAIAAYALSSPSAVSTPVKVYP